MLRTSFIAGVAIAVLLASCGVDINVDVGSGDDMPGSGTVIAEERTVTGFDRITLAGEGAVVVSPGPFSLTIETDDNLLSYIDTDVDGGTLEIATQRGVDIDPTKSVIYRITTPELVGITLSGAGSFDVPDWSTDAFTITLSGAGDIDMAGLTAADVDVTITGAGEVTLDGSVDDLAVSIPGAGSFRGADLESTVAVVTASGAGSATVWATERLDATLSGVGSIDYYGEPTVSQSVTGVGSINSRGPK